MSGLDLRSKLIGSPAFISLTSEQRIISTLRGLNWKAIHGCFYPDLKTEKLREIDVLAMQQWGRKKSLGAHVNIELILEAKSAKGFHLLFSQLSEASSYRQINDEWIGREGTNHERVFQAIIKAGLDDEHATFILKKFQRLAYPSRGGSRSLGVMPRPAKVYASAFRETNIGGEKDLDSAVLWKASQSLSSAVAGLKEQYLTYCLDGWLIPEIEMAPALKRDPTAAAIETLDMLVRSSRLYHPVVVIDAPLWVAEGGDIQSIGWCRFEQLNTSGNSEWWFDVVHSSHFEQYARELTEYYQKELRKRRTQLIIPDNILEFVKQT
jgi:hypothetical protein